jgi:hypothetical protein
MTVRNEGVHVRFAYRRTPNAVRLLATSKPGKVPSYEPGKLFSTVGRMARAVKAVGGKLDGEFPDKNQELWLTTLALLSLGFNPVSFGIEGEP